MTRGRFRLVLVAALLLLLLVTTVTLTWMTDTFVELVVRLRDLPDWVLALYLTLLAGIVGFFIWLAWWLFRPGKKRLLTNGHKKIHSVEELQRQLDSARKEGVETSQIEQELHELQRRKEAGSIHVSMFGEISSGKSSLINTLLPHADVHSDVVGGTTRSITEYVWTSSAGDELVIVDMPGLNEVDGQLDPLAAEEAQRAHIVLFVTDGDITRSQYQALIALRQLGKPIMVVLNKADWYSFQQLDQIRHAIKRQQGLEGISVVIVTAAGEEQLTRIDAKGNEECTTRPRRADISELEKGLQRLVDADRNILDELRDASVFVLAAKKLDIAVAQERHRRADQLISDYAKKAVVGGMAAVTPGTDLLIQGLLGTRLIRELSDLYEAPVREVDSDLLIKLVQKRVGTSATVILAVAGNGLKAFPGIGTVTGGLLHAVAYGMIFYTLGHAVAESLRSRGELRPNVADVMFKERFGSDMQNTVKQFARIAYNNWRGKSS